MAPAKPYHILLPFLNHNHIKYPPPISNTPANTK